MPRKPSDQLTLEFALKVFLLDGQARNLSPKTLATYAEQLTWFIAFAHDQEAQSLASVRPHHLKSYLIHLQARGWTPASQHVAFRTLRTFFRYCHFDGLLEENPMERLRAPKIPGRDLPAYTEADVMRILAAAPTQRDRAFLLCLLDITVLRKYLALVESDLQDAHARFGAVDHALR